MPQNDVQKRKTIDCRETTLEQLLYHSKFVVDFYQRKYVWERKQLEDLVTDLSSAFLSNWNKGDSPDKVPHYDPYFMGEIVLSSQNDCSSAIIDGQQRITTLMLLMIYILNAYKNKISVDLRSDTTELIYSNDHETKCFNLRIKERDECMQALIDSGTYTLKKDDSASVKNIVERYNDFAECWNEKINNDNAVTFLYWLKEKLVFSKVETNSDDFAYVIFESMNDRGLALTQVEMLRSYLLANIRPEDRDNSMKKLDEAIKLLTNIKLTSNSKAEFEFFKMFFRTHLADDLSQSKTYKSDFVQIGNGFHRWLRNNSSKLGLKDSQGFSRFIYQIDYFAREYAKIIERIQSRNTRDYLYLIVNSDYGFTLQPALILASIKYGDDDNTIDEKIKVVSKYLTKVLSWRVWNHYVISQSSLEASIYDLSKRVRDMGLDELRAVLAEDPLSPPALNAPPSLNQLNRKKIRVLLALITEIVATYSKNPDYMLNYKDTEIEHIWADHPEQHEDDCKNEKEFSDTRNNIGDLLLLRKSINASLNDAPYTEKVIQYFKHNILAKTLNNNQYQNDPDFSRYMTERHLPFQSYSNFTRASINERAELYRLILIDWDQKENPQRKTE